MSGQSNEQVSSLKIIVPHFLILKSGNDRPIDGYRDRSAAATQPDRGGTAAIAPNFM
ncbi:hypothetical protein [Burkholderia savannae]|uniref:hypothetical protein n=1 Tax=Burkholderia savannae TaxID=1637837 RepID=UPI000AC8E8C8|nr:hypothetical protein [Burkholderia savannae]